MFSFFLLCAWTIDSLFNIPLLGDPQIRPDGAGAAFSQNGKVHVLKGLAPGTGWQPAAIRSGRMPRWSPDGRLLAFLASDPGKPAQVFLYDVENGAVRRLTNALTSVTSFAWSRDSKGIGYLAVDGGPPPDPEVAGEGYKYSRLYLQPLAASEARKITAGELHIASFSLSPGGEKAVFAAHKTPRNQDSLQSDLYSVDLRTLEITPLVTQPGRDGEPSISPDGRWVAFHSQGGTTNYYAQRDVALVPIGGGTIRYLTRDQSIDVFRGGNAFSWSQDSKTLVYTAGKGVQDVLVRQEVESGQLTILTTGISGTASFTSDLRRALYLKSSVERPPELFLREGERETGISHVHDWVKKYPALRAETVRWKSRDGLEIEGVLWLPVGYQPGKRVPMLVELHGGPTGTALAAFPVPRVYPTQVFLQNGIAIFMPNFRGSAGYGAELRMKNAMSQGEGDFDDVMTGIDTLVERGIADPDRLGVMGWSYGGYLSTEVVTKTNRFRAASIGAPGTDWITYYGQFDGAKEVLWSYFGGTPWEVPESYQRHSPRSRLKNIKTPCLLQVGALDINHNGEIHQALRDIGVPVEYVVYPREYHGIVEPAHVRDLLERNLRWFSKWLSKADQ